MARYLKICPFKRFVLGGSVYAVLDEKKGEIFVKRLIVCTNHPWERDDSPFWMEYPIKHNPEATHFKPLTL